MILLKTYKESNGMTASSKRMSESKVASVEEAIRIGQKSGLFYEIFDTVSGRVIDWNEVNIREEEDWYYDEIEMIWKKQAAREAIEEPQFSFFNWLSGFNGEMHGCNLSY